MYRVDITSEKEIDESELEEIFFEYQIEDFTFYGKDSHGNYRVEVFVDEIDYDDLIDDIYVISDFYAEFTSIRV